jgi:glutamate 5-kinase
LGSGGYVTGKIFVDAGAVTAIQNRKSLLAVGIVRVEGDFEAGEIVEIHGGEEGSTNIIAVAKTRASSTQIQNNKQSRNVEVAHANDIVLM